MRLPSALRRLGSLVAKDLVVVTRNHYVTVVLALAVLYALAVHFLLPAAVGGGSELVVLDRTPGQTLGRAWAAAAPGRVELAGSEDALEEALRRGGGRIGVILDGSLADGGTGPEHATVVFQGFESPRVRQVVTAAVRAQLAALTGVPPAYARVEVVASRNALDERVLAADDAVGVVQQDGNLRVVLEGNEPAEVVDLPGIILGDILGRPGLELGARDLGRDASPVRPLRPYRTFGGIPWPTLGRELALSLLTSLGLVGLVWRPLRQKLSLRG